MPAVSGDPEGKAVAMAESAGLTFPVTYELFIEQMKKLGLYLSHPRFLKESDESFAEPGIFVVNAEDNVYLIDISNTPFNRSDPDELLKTVVWVQEKIIRSEELTNNFVWALFKSLKKIITQPWLKSGW